LADTPRRDIADTIAPVIHGNVSMLAAQLVRSALNVSRGVAATAVAMDAYAGIRVDRLCAE